ncbi:MAG: TrbG/VirB9 family P-type conjugative transfer protein [Pseudomonadota bacterium]|nr:TrbG/VirB9 family P-type conjugative transfer protein [Pseudomonadota bacterium]
MRFVISVILLFSCPSDLWAETRVRRIAVQTDQIVTVRTALGIATIIQVPDRPNSVVVGDQEAFKVEYLDQAITIKPLHGGANSNLYVYTDYQRFNVALATGAQSIADYVVYLENLKEKVKEPKPTLVWMRFKNILKNEAITLEVKRLGRAKDGVLIVEFFLRGLKKESIKPEWIWLTQSGATKPIQNLFLSGLEVRPGESVQGLMQISKSDIDEEAPIRIEMRRKKMSFLSIPKVVSWK